MGSLYLGRLIMAVNKGWVVPPFGITVSDLTKYIDANDEVRLKGDMSRTSTKSISRNYQMESPKMSHTEKMLSIDSIVPPNKQPGFQGMRVLHERSVFNDQSGDFPTPGMNEEKKLDIFKHTDTNYVNVKTCIGPSEAEQKKNFEELFQFYRENKKEIPREVIMDNVASKGLVSWLKTEKCAPILVTPQTKNQNLSEREMREVKAVTIKGMSTIDKEAPLSVWSHFPEVAEIIINTTRQSAHDPNMSAWEAMYGKPYDWDMHPLILFGSKLSVLEDPSTRASFATHAKAAISIGPAMEHIKGQRVFMLDTKATRVVSQFAIHPDARYQTPAVSDKEALAIAVESLVTLITKTAKSKQGSAATGLDEAAAAEAIASIKAQVARLSEEQPTALPPAVRAQRVDEIPPVPLQPANDVRVERVLNEKQAFPQPAQPAAQNEAANGGAEGVPKAQTPLHPKARHDEAVPSRVETQEEQEIYVNWVMCNGCGKWRKIPMNICLDSLPAKWYCKDNDWDEYSSCKVAEQVIATHPRPPSGPKALDTIHSAESARLRKFNKEYNQRHGLTKKSNKTPSTRKAKSHFVPAAPSRQSPRGHASSATPMHGFWQGKMLAASATTAVLSQQMRTAEARRLPGRQDAVDESIVVELRRITSGPTKCVTFVPQGTRPHGKKPCRVSMQTKFKEKEQGVEMVRTRITADSSQVPFEGETKADTADLTTIKILLSKIASDPLLRFSKIDIRDFFPTHNLPNGEHEYMMLPLRSLPQEAIDEFGLAKLANKNGEVECLLTGAIYGLQQSARISQEAINALLEKTGWKNNVATPCIYSNVAYPNMDVIRLTDDFGISHITDEELDAFGNVLKGGGYEIVTTPDTKEYAGIDVEIRGEGKNKEVAISLIGYITEMLLEFDYEPKAADSPGVYQRPVYGKQEQLEEVDVSDQLGAKDISFVRTVVGKMLWYGRTCDPNVLLACNKIATSDYTANTLKMTYRLLDYAATHRTATIVYKACDMVLKGQSDATFDSESHSRSRYAGWLFFGNKNDAPKQGPPDFSNGAVLAWTRVHKTVITSAPASEYGGFYNLGREAEMAIDICIAFRLPQFCTPLWTDNTTAIALANSTCGGKRTKTMARQSNWIAEQVKLGNFSTHWESGKTILANALTKFVPVHEHLDYARRFVTYPPNSAIITTQRTRRNERAKAIKASSPSLQTNMHKEGVLAKASRVSQ